MRPETKELVKLWNKLYNQEKNKAKKMDCGSAARHIAKKAGGNGRGKTHIIYAKPHHVICAEKDISDAISRYSTYPDRIEKSDIEDDDRYFICIHRGDGDVDLNENPGHYFEKVLDRKIELLPGMLIYSVETWSNASKGKAKWKKYYKCTKDFNRWDKHHMVMYVGDGKVMDLWPANTKSEPKEWKDVYSGAPDLFVTINVLDPFQDYRPEEIILDGNVLKKGKSNKDVLHLNKALIQLGYLDKEEDNQFDEHTEKALTTYQSDKNMKADGIYGACSCTALVRDLLAQQPLILK